MLLAGEDNVCATRSMAAYMAAYHPEVPVHVEPEWRHGAGGMQPRKAERACAVLAKFLVEDGVHERLLPRGNEEPVARASPAKAA